VLPQVPYGDVRAVLHRVVRADPLLQTQRGSNNPCSPKLPNGEQPFREVRDGRLHCSYAGRAEQTRSLCRLFQSRSGLRHISGSSAVSAPRPSRLPVIGGAVWRGDSCCIGRPQRRWWYSVSLRHTICCLPRPIGRICMPGGYGGVRVLRVNSMRCCRLRPVPLSIWRYTTLFRMTWRPGGVRPHVVLRPPREIGMAQAGRV